MSSLAMFLCMELLIAEVVPPGPARAQSSALHKGTTDLERALVFHRWKKTEKMVIYGQTEVKCISASCPICNCSLTETTRLAFQSGIGTSGYRGNDQQDARRDLHRPGTQISLLYIIVEIPDSDLNSSYVILKELSSAITHLGPLANSPKVLLKHMNVCL